MKRNRLLSRTEAVTSLAYAYAALFLLTSLGWTRAANGRALHPQVNDTGHSKHVERSYEKPFDPSHQTLSTSTKEVRIALKRREPCTRCPGGSRFIFEVTNKRQGTKSEFVLENETSQVDEVHILSPSKTAVIGRVLSSTSIVNVVDNETGRLIDSFYCFSPTLSENKRFIAYVKVFPAHFVEGVSAEYLVYDFTRIPQENRYSEVSLDNRIDVGLPIFPPGSLNRPGDNVAVEETQRHMLASSGFFWSRDSKKIAFADRSNGKNSVAVVDIYAGVETARVQATNISPSEVVDIDRCACADYKAHPEHAFHVSHIAYVQVNPTRIKVEFSSLSPACLKQYSLELQLP